MPSTPRVFAHRGSVESFAEHTLAAYLLAIAAGVDGLECDVRLTRDGHLVCLHDRRLERTSDGRGLVSRYTLDQLRQLDFGARWPGPAANAAAADAANAAALLPGGVDVEADLRSRVLTLDRLIGVARDAGRPLELLVETKHPTRYGGGVEYALYSLLRRHGLHQPDPDDPVRVTVMSFSVLALRRIRQLAPQLPTVLLLEVVPPGLRGGGLPFGVTHGGPSVRLARSRPHLAHRLRERGRGVYVWTVNSPADIDTVIKLGVDGIISDHPGRVIRRLRELGLRDHGS